MKVAEVTTKPEHLLNCLCLRQLPTHIPKENQKRKAKLSRLSFFGFLLGKCFFFYLNYLKTSV